jgi:hypothetical protein
MKSTAKLAALAAPFLLATPLAAQWRTATYSLKGGWNAIRLSGDAKHDEIAILMPSVVQEIWRWDPNPSQTQFSDSPLIPTAGTPEWAVWKRDEPQNSTLSQLTGQASYLVKCSGTSTTTHTVSLLQSPLPPTNQWVRNGANLMGFPTYLNGANYPLMGTYFSTFPIATATSSKIFKYIGGDLGPSNPLQVFSPSVERLDATKAYWFSAEAVGNFIGPIEISLSNPAGLRYGRSGSLITVYLKNRSTAPVTVTFTPTPSEGAPTGQPAITGPVPLTRRTFNTSTLAWTETPIAAAITEIIAPQATVEVSFGINRADASMSGAADGAFFASFLRVTESGNLMDVHLPVSATKSSLAGLWVGDISLKQVSNASTTAGDTPAEFPLRTLLHVSDGGTASLLSQVFIGQLASAPHDVGLCTDESQLKQDAKSSARRLVSAHMPLDRVITSGSGSVAIGSTLNRTIHIPYNDPSNPFVHQYHPDHDNKNPRGDGLPAGVESYDIFRACAFTFTASPPPGSGSITGWGSSVIGGTYTETITGLHRDPITLNGTFTLRRASEVGVLTP